MNDMPGVGVIRLRVPLATDETHDLVLPLPGRPGIVENDCEVFVSLQI